MPRMNKRGLQELIGKRKKETQETQKRVIKKRAKSKTTRDEYGDKFNEQLSNGGQTPKERLNWLVVRRWFYESLTRNFADKHTFPEESVWWGGKEQSLAKKLLKLYSGELIHSGIIHLCDNWEVMVENSNGKLSGLPTIGFLWATRERIIGEVEAGEQPEKNTRRKKNNRAEYDPDEDDMPGVGW